MAETKDIILSELVRKKKSLLEKLLALSIRSVFDNTYEAKTVQQRSQLLEMLIRNDRAISTREQQTGMLATIQEQNLFEDIAILLSSIQDNNNNAIIRLNKAEKENEAERLNLGRGKSLANYVNQTKSLNHFRTQKPRGREEKNLLRGIL